MKSIASAILISCAAGACVGPAVDSVSAQDAVKSPPATTGSRAERRAFPAKRLAFYQVPLVCPAAPQIGCGSASKPVLVALESRGAISEAWLNRAGTTLAVVWSEKASSGERSQALQGVLKACQLEAKEMKGADRKQALKSFQSDVAWYRGAQVDQLSGEEAEIVGDRWVDRIREKVSLTPEKARALHEGFSAAIRRKLLGEVTRDQVQQDMLKTCRENLDDQQMAVLLEAFKGQIQSPPSTQ